MKITLDDVMQALEDAIMAEDIEDSDNLTMEVVNSIVESFEANVKSAFTTFQEDEDGTEV